MSPIPKMTDIDIFKEESLANPFDDWHLMRDAGPVVFLPKYDLHVAARFSDVQAALTNPKLFSSAKGVTLNPMANELGVKTTIGCDDPLHAKRRSILERPLLPARLIKLRECFAEEARRLVEEVVGAGPLDVASGFAQRLPVNIVYGLLGLPDVQPEQLLSWTEAGFNGLAPEGNALSDAGLPAIKEMMNYSMQCTRESVHPDGWAAQLFSAVDEGLIDMDDAVPLVFDYVAPSLDTTIIATISAISLFGRNPGMWKHLRANPSKIPNAINEVVRLRSPIRGFSRVTTEVVTIDGVVVPSDTRIMLLYGSGNRDERRWESPDEFDIDRRNTDHLGFGRGVHTCVGANLARLEISSILAELVRQVEEIEIHSESPLINNFLFGSKSLVATFHSA